MGADEVNAFLTSLAVDRHVSAATLNPRRSEQIPVVLTPQEARLVIDDLEGASRLVTQSLYGGGLRLLECLQLGHRDVATTMIYVVVAVMWRRASVGADLRGHGGTDVT